MALSIPLLEWCTTVLKGIRSFSSRTLWDPNALSGSAEVAKQSISSQQQQRLALYAKPPPSSSPDTKSFNCPSLWDLEPGSMEPKILMASLNGRHERRARRWAQLSKLLLTERTLGSGQGRKRYSSSMTIAAGVLILCNSATESDGVRGKRLHKS